MENSNYALPLHTHFIFDKTFTGVRFCKITSSASLQNTPDIVFFLRSIFFFFLICIQGDGGSPLVCEHDSVAHLVGLVSWGIGCGTASIPGVYVDVSVYIPWIEKQMRSEEAVKIKR